MPALRHLRSLARRQASRLEEGGKEAVQALCLGWGCRLSVALQKANVLNLRRAVGAAGLVKARQEVVQSLPEDAAG